MFAQHSTPSVRSVARQYEALKKELAAQHPNDRLAYTTGKRGFILGIMARLRGQSGHRGDCPPGSHTT